MILCAVLLWVHFERKFMWMLLNLMFCLIGRTAVSVTSSPCFPLSVEHSFGFPRSKFNYGKGERVSQQSKAHLYGYLFEWDVIETCFGSCRPCWSVKWSLAKGFKAAWEKRHLWGKLRDDVGSGQVSSISFWWKELLASPLQPSFGQADRKNLIFKLSLRKAKLICQFLSLFQPLKGRSTFHNGELTFSMRQVRQSVMWVGEWVGGGSGKWN